MTASVYHSPFFTSVKLLAPLMGGSPSRRYSTVTSMALVIGSFVLKVVSLVPLNRPFCTAKATLS